MAERPMEHFTVDGVNIFEVTDAKARQDVSDLKDDFHSYHSELGAGYADQLVSSIENTDSVPYNFRKVPVDATLECGEIVGVTVNLNQLLSARADGTYTSNGVTFTASDGIITATGTASGGTAALEASGITPTYIADHVYYIGGGASGGAEGTYRLWANSNTAFPVGYRLFDVGNGAIKKARATESTGRNVQVQILNGVTVNNAVFRANVFDLTATFGTAIADYVHSLEQATAGSGVAWLKKNFPKIFDSGYVPYNAGTMVHVSGLSAKRTVGFNQWDEVAEVGGIDANTGENVSGATGIRSKNYIPVFPDVTYYNHVGSSTGDNFQTRFYDADKNYIGYAQKNGNPVLKNNTFVIPSNAHYMRFQMQITYGTTYNHDICINLSDPAKNGTYEPYTMHEYPLDSSIDLHGILKLDAQNNLYADGDVYKADGSISRRYGVVDLGTLDWGKGNTQSGHWRFTSTLSTAKLSASSASVPNLICTKYNSVSPNDAWVGTTGVTINNSSPLMMVCDEAYADAAAFKTAMSGVMLVYELATPTTETAEPYTATQICDPNGTEEFISDTVAPVGHTTKYLENLRKKIEGLPWNFATLIAPTEATFKATRNYTTRSLFIVNNVLYKATANIANGATITPNSNCTATTLAEVISALS